ncbi:MAG: type II toxin-antitoxin system RelE/ParE family toxin [Acidobacteriota bacterium]
MNFAFHPEARVEFIEAIAYYETCRAGLGIRFSREVHSTIERITRRPSAWPKNSKYTRRCLTTRFPFGVIYEIRKDDVLIIAVTHLNRKPGYWVDRIQ